MGRFGTEMRAGRLRHRLELQKKSTTTTIDSYGAETNPYVTQCVVWGSIEPISGTEYFAAKQTQATTSHKIRIRYYSSITTVWRIKYGTRIFEIDSIINFNEKNQEQILMCSEAV